MKKYGRTSMRLCDLDEIKICVDRQYENCHGYSGSKKAIYREAILAVKSILHSAKPIDGVTVQEWISVKDRLPEMGEHYQSEDVLVCIDYRPDDPDTTKDSYVSIDHVDFNCFGQGWFSCERDDPRDGEPSPYFVTHWMPMPLAPEAKNSDTGKCKNDNNGKTTEAAEPQPDGIQFRTVDDLGRICIPKDIRDKLGIKPGTECAVYSPDEIIVIRRK